MPAYTPPPVNAPQPSYNPPVYSPPPVSASPPPGGDPRWESVPGARPMSGGGSGGGGTAQPGVVIGLPQGERAPQYAPLPPGQVR